MYDSSLVLGLNFKDISIQIADTYVIPESYRVICSSYILFQYFSSIYVPKYDLPYRNFEMGILGS